MEDVGGYDFKLVEEGDIDLECPICLSLVREAMGTPCSHLLCRSCFIKFQQSSGSKFICPNCKAETDYVKVVPSAFADRLVTRSEVFCQQKDTGCVWKGSINSYFQKHQMECEFKIVHCTNDGCNVRCSRKTINDHKHNCEHRLVNCIHCNEVVKFTQIQEHHADDCQRFPIKCIIEDCLEMLPRNEIEEHVNQNCVFVKINCQFAKLGCCEKVERRFIQQHCTDSINQHNTLMIEKLLQSENTIKQLTSANDHLNKKVNELEAEIKNVKPNQITNANIKVKTTVAAANLVASIQPEVNLLGILENGLKKFIYKENMIMSLYKEWYGQIRDLMEVNKLYRGAKSLFIKIKYEGGGLVNKICWNSNTREKQRTMGRHIVYFENEHVVLQRLNGLLHINTATYEEGYTVNNGYECYLFHPRNIITREDRCGLLGSSFWSVNIPRGRGDFPECFIFCLCK